jgi:hypothetical protein
VIDERSVQRGIELRTRLFDSQTAHGGSHGTATLVPELWEISDAGNWGTIWAPEGLDMKTEVLCKITTLLASQTLRPSQGPHRRREEAGRNRQGGRSRMTSYVMRHFQQAHTINWTAPSDGGRRWIDRVGAGLRPTPGGHSSTP